MENSFGSRGNSSMRDKYRWRKDDSNQPSLSRQDSSTDETSQQRVFDQAAQGAKQKSELAAYGDRMREDTDAVQSQVDAAHSAKEAVDRMPLMDKISDLGEQLRKVYDAYGRTNSEDDRRALLDVKAQIPGIIVQGEKHLSKHPTDSIVTNMLDRLRKLL